MQITVSPKSEIAQVAADKISRCLQNLNNTPLLFLLSGGSAFEVYDYLDVLFFSINTTIGMLDERFSNDPTVNNFCQFKKTSLYKRLNGLYPCIDTSLHKTEIIGQVARRFEESLRNWKQENQNGKVVAVVGVGCDGHTSGIMPIPEDKKKFEELFENEKWVVGYDTEERIPFRERVTTTITFTKNEIDYSFVYISDEKKKDILEKVLEKDKPIHEIPGRVINEMKNVEILTVVNV